MHHGQVDAHIRWMSGIQIQHDCMLVVSCGPVLIHRSRNALGCIDISDSNEIHVTQFASRVSAIHASLRMRLLSEFE